MDNPLIRVMALHALAYCERLFYLEELEEIRVADHRIYARPLERINSSRRAMLYCSNRSSVSRCMTCGYRLDTNYISQAVKDRRRPFQISSVK